MFRLPRKPIDEHRKGMAYSLELKEKIVRAYETKKFSIRLLAEVFSMSTRSVQKYLNKAHAGESLAPGPHFARRPPYVPDEHLDRIRWLVAERNNRTLDEYAARYTEKYGVSMRKSTMHKAPHRAGFTRKKKTWHASEADSENNRKQRKSYVRRAWARRTQPFVFIDEFGMNRVTSRQWAWAVHDRRASDAAPKNPDPNMTLIVALTECAGSA